tara:strand:- start:233 stop:2155 length:1923 start_codon:yes stop_codon:yes gene_type:complete
MSINERLKLGDKMSEEQREALLSLFNLDDKPSPPDEPEDERAGLLATGAWLYASESLGGYRGMDRRGSTDFLLRQAFPTMDSDDGSAANFLNLGYNIPNFDHMEEDPDWDGTTSPHWDEMDAHEIDAIKDWDGLKEIPHEEMSTGDMVEGIMDSALNAETRVQMAIQSWLGLIDTSDIPGLKWIPKHHWEWEDDDYMDALIKHEEGDTSPSADGDGTNIAQDVYEMILRLADTTTSKETIAILGDWIDLDNETKRPMWSTIWGDGTKYWGTEVDFIIAAIGDLRMVRDIANDVFERIDLGQPLVETPITRGVEDHNSLDLQVEAILYKSEYRPTGPTDGHNWIDRQPKGPHGQAYFTSWVQQRRDERFIISMAKILDNVQWRWPGELIRHRCNQISGYCRRNWIGKYAEHTVIAAIANRVMKRTKALRPMHLMAFLTDRPRHKGTDEQRILINPWKPDYQGYAPISSIRVKSGVRDIHNVTYTGVELVPLANNIGCWCKPTTITTKGRIIKGGNLTTGKDKTLPHSVYTALNPGWVRNNKMMPRVERSMGGMTPSLVFKPANTYDETHSGGIALGVEWYLRAYLPSGKLASHAWQAHCKRLITKLVKLANDFSHRRHLQLEMADEYYGQLLKHAHYNKLC